VGWSLVALVVVAGATWAGLTWHHHNVYGTIVGEDRQTLTVDRGERFSIGVRDHGLSVGDHWTAQAAPASALAAAGEHKVSSNWLERIGIHIETDGGGDGTRYFVYDPKQAGTATVTLSNCFQGCHFPSPYTRSVTWTITVK
jgi:hypothetical protein